ncbi:TonB family protein [Lysobacter sp. CA196]|uniref:TonB family protein n=1 Tax=Lysobacter sp. CA196 TaxID=3455606 RepID=UPI003F8D3B3A
MKSVPTIALVGALFLIANDANAQGVPSIDATLDKASKFRHRPVYPEQAIPTCASGTTVIIIDVDDDGRFVDAVVEKSSRNAHLDRAALEASRQWTYSPASDEQGNKVADKIRIPVDFEEHESCWTQLIPDTLARPEPSTVERSPPRWPAIVDEKGLSGEVVVLVLLEEDGWKHEVRVGTSSGDPAIDSAAVQAAENWRYEPAVLDGKPVRTVLRWSMHYGKGAPDSR